MIAVAPVEIRAPIKPQDTEMCLAVFCCPAGSASSPIETSPAGRQKQRTSMARTNNRPDNDGTHRLAFKHSKKMLYTTQTVCGICGKAVDFGLKFPRPLSPCVDRIIPDEPVKTDIRSANNGIESFSILMRLGITKKNPFRTVWQRASPNEKPQLITAHREDQHDGTF